MNLNSFLSEAASSFLLVGLLGAALGASGAFPACAATGFVAAGGAAGVLLALFSILFIVLKLYLMKMTEGNVL